MVGWGLGIVVLLFSFGPLHAQRELTHIPDPDPEGERRSFQVADGFEVNLFAADPLLAKPIQMNFDAAGRLWVACSEVYPHIKPGQKANDKVIILEDRAGSGRADRVTVFADGLLIPTGVEPGDGGAYVADSTDLLHLRDSHGTGKADRRRVVLSGFGTEDTHHILHTLRWGPDGLLYFNQSIYIHSHIETPHGVRRLGGGGIWQLRPETLQLEVFARGFVNPWGHHFDRWGQSFVTDGAYGEGINYLVPGAMYFSAPGASRILAGLNPGSPKHCGLEILSGRHLPEDWRGNALTNDFRGHRVCRFVLSEDGSGFASREKAELIKTTHAAFRPVDVKMGPDGAIYIADWYNPIIQHGEVDFRDPRRDHTHGRIWRVTAKGRPLVPRPQLVNAGTAALLEAVRAPEDWTRHQAKRVLKERGPEIVPALTDWVRHLSPTDPDHEHHLLEALWSYQALDVPEPELLAALLHARDHRARAAAVRVLAHWQERLADPLGLLTTAVDDDHPRVRLEAVRALGGIPSAQAAEVALRALDRPMDRFLDYALWLTARDLEARWLPKVMAKQMDFGGNVRHLLFALEAVDSPQAVRPLVDLIHQGKLSADQKEKALTLIANRGGPEELSLVFDLALAGRDAHLLEALEQAANQRGVRPVGDLSRLGQLLDAKDLSLCMSALHLAGRWRVEALRFRLVAWAGAPDASPSVRRAALEALAALGGTESQNTLEKLAGAGQPIDRRISALTALAALDLEAAGRQAADVLASLRAGSDPSELIGSFLGRKNGGIVLAAAINSRNLAADVAKVALRSIPPSHRDAATLVAALKKAGGLSASAQPLTPQQMQSLVADVAHLGDPARGERIFRRSDLGCLKCHAIAGAGGQVGPDLASIGASAPVDYLAESILLPNKAVKEGYHALSVATREGRFFTGVKVRETKTDLVLRDAEDREVAIPLALVEERTIGGSLMPEGLADLLTRQELVDLVRFLSELGKVGPYSVSKARVARRWQVRASEGGEWSPAYALVSGELPLDAVPASGQVRCEVDVSSPGQVRLRLNTPAGLTVSVDGARDVPQAALLLDLASGRHTVTFTIDRGRRREGLRCELEDVPGSPARAQFIGGK
jgi:putative heme-binding domain-containing protein